MFIFRNAKYDYLFLSKFGKIKLNIKSISFLLILLSPWWIWYFFTSSYLKLIAVFVNIECLIILFYMAKKKSYYCSFLTPDMIICGMVKDYYNRNDSKSFSENQIYELANLLLKEYVNNQEDFLMCFRDALSKKGEQIKLSKLNINEECKIRFILGEDT